MRQTPWTMRLAMTPLAPVAVLPLRVGQVARQHARLLRRTSSWLVRSREHVHYTYDLEPLNLEHLAWVVSTVADRPVEEVRGYLAELADDTALREVVRGALAGSPRRSTADAVVRYGRRVGWYAFARALRPRFVVETGTNRGLGSAVVAAALLRNGHGRLATVDRDPRAGELILPPYRSVVDHTVGDSLTFLAGPVARQRPIDLLLVDTGHSPELERAELAAATPLLAPHAVVLATKAYCWPELSRWAEETGRQFTYFGEKPRDHWYPGVGIGVAYPSRATV